MTTDRLRALLLLAAAGGFVVAVRFLPVGVELGGVLAMLIATALTAPAPAEPAAQLRWWRLLALGSALAVIGVPLALLLETFGGLLAGAGGAVAIVGVCFGWPATPASPSTGN